MSNKRQFRLTKNFIPRRQTIVLYPAFCILLSAFFFFIIIPSFSTIWAERFRQVGPPERTTEVSDGWAATYGGYNYDWAASVQQTRDGGYIVAGYYTSYSVSSFIDEGWGYWVLKLRPDGTVEWQKAYSGVGAESVRQTSDGGYVVAGATRSFSAGGEEIHHLLVLKLRPDGAVEWEKIYGGGDWDRSNSIQQTGDGGYIVAGWTRSFGAGKEDFWVLKLRPDGDVEWQKAYGGADRDEAEAIEQTTDGGYIVAGWTRSFGAGDYDAWVLKLRPDGAVEWQKTYGGDNVDEANSIQQTLNGGYIVAGGTRSFGIGKVDLWVLKLRPDGTVEWQKTYGGDNFDNANSICQTNDEGYIVAGHTDSFSAGGVDLWVLKLGPDGTVEWQKAYGGVDWDEAESTQQTRDGGYIVAGKTASFNPRSKILDLWVLKLKPDGSVHPSCSYFIRDSGASGINSNAIILNTVASVKSSNANPQNASVKVNVTNVSANILCP